MPCKRAKRSSRRVRIDDKAKTAPTTAQGNEEPDNDSSLSHFDFLREFRQLKLREEVFDYSEPLFQVSNLETLRMNLRSDEDAKRFLRLNLSQRDVEAVRHAYEHPSGSPTKKPPSVARALNMIQSSSVSSIDEALQYYCGLHKLQRMINEIGDEGVKRDFAEFHRRFVHAFDVQPSST